MPHKVSAETEYLRYCHFSYLSLQTMVFQLKGKMSLMLGAWPAVAVGSPTLTTMYQL